METLTNISPGIHLEIISDRGSEIKRLIDVPPAILRDTLSWEDSYNSLSYENTLLSTESIWLLDFSHPRHDRMKYYAHVFHTLSELQPFIFLGEDKSRSTEYGGIYKWLTSQYMCSVFKFSEARALSDTIRKVLGSTPEDLILTIGVSIHGLEVQFYNREIHVAEMDYIKSLLGRNDSDIKNISIGRDRTFIKIRFLDGSVEYLPSDILRAKESRSSTLRSRDAYDSSASVVGKRIRYFREKAVLTQSELGDRIGKSRHTIMRFESGQILPKVSDLEHISKAVHMELLDFLSSPTVSE